MHIEFRHGPKDGERRFLPFGKVSETIIVELGDIEYLYKATTRRTRDNICVIYQCLGILSTAA